MKKYLGWGLVGLIGLYLANEYFRADYLAFDRQREVWHRRCDAYINQVATSETEAIITSCNRELQELFAYAKRKGWN